MSQRLAGQLLKGLYSATVVVLGALTTILVGDTTFAAVTDGQWVSIALTGLVAFGGTFGLSGWPGPRVNGHGPSGGSGG